jgi:hypothetical protein
MTFRVVDAGQPGIGLPGDLEAVGAAAAGQVEQGVPGLQPERLGDLRDDTWPSRFLNRADRPNG